MKANTGNLVLIGQGGVTKRSTAVALGKPGGAATGAVLGGAACVALVTFESSILAFFTFSLSFLGLPAEYAACAALASAGAAIGFATSGRSGGPKQAPAPKIPPSKQKYRQTCDFNQDLRTVRSYHM